VYVLGIDVGTQGARAIVVDLAGQVHAETASAFPAEQVFSTEPGRFEQDPCVWRKAVFEAVSGAVAGFLHSGHQATDIAALSVTSTSGTLCLVDEQGEPVGAAIMYSDSRASAMAEEVQAAGSALATKLGTRFNASFALSKLHWLRSRDPQQLQRARWFLSPTDLVIGWLTGIWGHTDWANALKWGYDVVDLCWPEFIATTLGFPHEKFPQVQPPGSILGQVSAQASVLTGLMPQTLVVAGATDGVVSQLASGAVVPGDWNSTLGTTLVLKGVSTVLLRDPLGRIYSHRHPDGCWLPGGASSTGADCLAQRFDAQRLPELNARALDCCPTDLVVYPLMRRGERFPFSVPEATGFCLGETADETIYFAAHLEGLSYVEKLCYAVLQELGAAVGDTLYVAGGGTNSPAGLQIRADILERRLRVPSVASGAMGAAILAARGCVFPTLAEATASMVHYRQVIEPRLANRPAYQERYQRFLAACRERGYLS
jgi:D-ribulokinase